MRRSASLPQAGDTRWTVRSSWPSPSFGGDFLPGARKVGDQGIRRHLPDRQSRARPVAGQHRRSWRADSRVPRRHAPIASRRRRGAQTAQISLIQPVDLYSQVNRATKYGFLFIGFTFLALLMFDVIGGVRVSAVEYLLMGAALVLFFVLLLAFAEVIGFTPAYILASGAIAGLNTAYSAAVLGAGGGPRSSAGCSSAFTPCSTSSSASKLSRC